MGLTYGAGFGGVINTKRLQNLRESQPEQCPFFVPRTRISVSFRTVSHLGYYTTYVGVCYFDAIHCQVDEVRLPYSLLNDYFEVLYCQKLLSCAIQQVDLWSNTFVNQQEPLKVRGDHSSSCSGPTRLAESKSQ